MKLLSTLMMLAAFSTILFSTTPAVSAFSTPHIINNKHAPPHATTISSIQLMATSSTINDDTPTNNNANEKMRQLGNSIILSAAKFHGATDQMVTIEWKADRIVVTIDVDKDDGDNNNNMMFVEDDSGAAAGELEEEFEDIDVDDFEEFEEEEFEEYEEGEFEEYEDDYTEDEFEEEEEEDFEALQAQLGLQPEQDTSTKNKKIDLTLIARTINEYLSADGEDTPQFKIAQLHEIEVTSPEFDNVLRTTNHNGGVDMFEVYKGFDVIVDYWEVPKTKKKKKKMSGKADKEENVLAEAAESEQQQQQEEEEPKRTQKIIEGKLVGRDYDKDVTMINVKGRIVKIKNEMIENVMLPKAKREKGVK